MNNILTDEQHASKPSQVSLTLPTQGIVQVRAPGIHNNLKLMQRAG